MDAGKKVTKLTIEEAQAWRERVNRQWEGYFSNLIVVATDEFIEVALNANTCRFETTDGNSDDPTSYYCGLPHAHVGDHGDWKS